MQAIIVKLGGKPLLFPDGFDFIFPDYVLEHKETIISYMTAADEMTSAMRKSVYSDVDNIQKKLVLLKKELSEFKARTGVIGYPFDLKDVSLYILDKNIDVVAVMEL